jgi:hypothetical protein
MTEKEARKWLASGPDTKDPKTWEAYYIVYDKRHPRDPLFDDGGANDRRIYNSTPQEFNPEEWPEAEFEDAHGYNTINASPYPLNPKHFATEATAKMLAERLNAKAVWVDGPKSGPYFYPGAWHLDFGVKGKLPNAGLVGNLWNRAIGTFKRNIENWNRNLGENNRYTDPQTNTPTTNVLLRLKDELGTGDK